MTNRRYVLTFISLVLLPLTLFHFQNCAPPNSSARASSDGSKVGLIDNLNKASIQFVTADSQVQDDAKTVEIFGLCSRDHDNAVLKWTVFDEYGSQKILAQGISQCDHGQFGVEIDELDQYVCGVSHMLVVEGDWGGSTFSNFTRRCQPLISTDATPDQNMPLGTTCSIEYSAAGESGPTCQRLCYRANQVVFSQPLDVSSCSTLAASLAGQ